MIAHRDTDTITYDELAKALTQLDPMHRGGYAQAKDIMTDVTERQRKAADRKAADPSLTPVAALRLLDAHFAHFGFFGRGPEIEAALDRLWALAAEGE